MKKKPIWKTLLRAAPFVLATAALSLATRPSPSEAQLPEPTPPPGNIFFDYFLFDNGGQPANDLNTFLLWNVTEGSVDLVGGNVPGVDDEVNGRFVDLDGGDSGRFATRESFALVPGNTYNFSVEFRSTDGRSNAAQISIGSKRYRIATSSTTPQTFSVDFSFDSAETAPIVFQDEGDDDRGVGIDAVLLNARALQPTPAPTTIAGPGATVAPTTLPTAGPTANPGATPRATPTTGATAAPVPTAVPNASAPRSQSLSPARPWVLPGAFTRFTATVSDASGTSDIDRVLLRISNSRYYDRGIVAVYSNRQNRVFLFNDAGRSLIGGITPGSTARISNSQGTLDGRGTSVSRSGNTLSVSFNISVSSALAGRTMPMSLLVRDSMGLEDSLRQFGTLSVSGNQRPGATALSPSTSANAPGQTRIFTATFRDANGVDNLSQVLLRVRRANSNASADAFTVSYNVASDRLFVSDAAGTGSVRSEGTTPGTRGVIASRLGALDAQATTVQRSGDTLRVSFAMRASSGLIGSNRIFGQVTDAGGLSSGETSLGTWNISGTTRAR